MRSRCIFLMFSQKKSDVFFAFAEELVWKVVIKMCVCLEGWPPFKHKKNGFKTNITWVPFI